MENITLNINDLTKQVTVNVNISGYQGWLFKLDIAILLIKLAVLISGVKVVFDGNDKQLQHITDVVARCSCGWTGTVYDCEPDIDGDGSLRCPVCSKVIVVR